MAGPPFVDHRPGRDLADAPAVWPGGRAASVHRRRMALETRLQGLDMRRGLHAHLAAQGAGREAIVHARWGG